MFDYNVIKLEFKKKMVVTMFIINLNYLEIKIYGTQLEEKISYRMNVNFFDVILKDYCNYSEKFKRIF